ncbi:MAG: response regulator transcription factor [Pirellula sp.]|jgi:DNA-binding response OmpR family regulator|nr:response regulator transcription factor [Pirellula sp.]
MSLNNHSQRILIVEDDHAIRRGLADALRFAGYQVYESARGDEGIHAALSNPIDLVVLDVVLPGCSGMDVLRRIRESESTLPVIMLTARGEESDRVAGLRSGADDYVVKPFGLQELLARIEAVLRRTPERPQANEKLSFAGGCINFQRREIRLDNQTVHLLSEKEWELVSYLAKHHSRVVSRDEILSHVWKISPRGLQTRTIDMTIARLREKLGDASDDPKILITVRGHGYMFCTPVSSTSD